MTDFRLRRSPSPRSTKTDTAARVARVVGQNLRDIRRGQGHSLDTLASKSGVSRAMLGQIETGKSVPTITVLWRVADALGVPVAQLISDPDVPLYTVTRREAAETASGKMQARNRAIVDHGGSGGLLFQEISLPPGEGQTSAPQRSGGSITLVVATGGVQIKIADADPVMLGEGDAITFSAGLKYKISNPGTLKVILYLAATSPRKGV